MVKIIELIQTLPARSAALRNGLELEKCYVPEDGMVNSFHIGYELEGKIVGTASFYPVSLAEQGENGYQLRLMGVVPSLQGKGLGAAVLLEGIEEVKKCGAAYLWCNARQVAIPFYEKLGFVVSSDFFDIPNIGSHKQMILKL